MNVELKPTRKKKKTLRKTSKRKMSKVSLKNALKLYVLAWNDNSDSYMDIEDVSREILGEKDEFDVETAEMLIERLGKLERMKNALFDKWIATTGSDEMSIYRHYKSVEKALKNAQIKLSRIKYKVSLLNPKNIEDIQECYAG